MIKLSFRDVSADKEKDTLSLSRVVPVKINNTIFYCEHAVSEQERTIGLMFRKFLPANRGMLFDTFGRYKPVFHMKNVYFPLEAIFVSNMNTVVDIVPMIPMDGSSIYTTPKVVPIKGVIEVNRNFCSSHGIKLNDKVFVLSGSF